MIETLLQPADCLFLFVDFQAGLAFGAESIARLPAREIALLRIARQVRARELSPARSSWRSEMPSG